MTKKEFRPSALLVLVVFSLALWPQLIWLAKRTLDDPEGSLGLLALLTCVCLGWSQRKSLVSKPRLGWALLSLTVASSFLLPPLLVSLLAVLAISSACGLLRIPGLLGLAVLTLPVMASCNFYFGWPLRLGISACTEFLLQIGGLAVSREGTLLLFENAVVGVDPPCSGLKMLWFTGYLFCALSALHRLPWRAFLALLLVAFLLSFVGNVLRAFLLFFPESGLVTWPSWTHEAVGIILHLGGALILHALITRTNLKPSCKTPLPFSSSAPVSV